ncbi:MAG: hypothetical protein KGS48_03590 [Bacteroidetes bacterium]|nr:hypothetical protein [Bacteroidota bacterium]
MNLEKFLVIAGFPGVHKLVATRSNGLVIEDRHEKRTRFVPVRQQQVTPLATIAIYTDTEEGTVSLTSVFEKMLELLESNPPVSPDANSAELRAYFTSILPEHDQDRVHINDIKKCIKWFSFMLKNGIFEEAKKETANADQTSLPETDPVENPETDLPTEQTPEN